MLTRLRCTLTGHRWDWGREPFTPTRCDRCGVASDDAGVILADRRFRTARRWSPLWITLKRRDLTVRLGWEFVASLTVRLHFGWDRTSELPGLNVSLHVWRLRVWAGIGSGWQDEDGDGRSFVGLNVTFTTYGLRYVGCWFGHKPETKTYSTMPDFTYCARCDKPLDEHSAGAAGKQSAA
jgi:hypothetical protein